MSETVDLRTPAEIARLRHFLRSALNNIVGYADVVRRQAEEQGARASAGMMGQVAVAGREAIEILQHLLPVKSHVSESALPMLRSNLAPRVERIESAVAAFEAKTRGACAAEIGKMRLALQDIAEFQRGAGETRPDPAPPPDPAPQVFEMPPAAAFRQLPRAGGYALVVDNDDADRDELARLLRSAGLTPVAEADADAALERLRRERFDLVLLDAAMPEMLAELRATPGLAGLPVLVLAGSDRQDAAVRALEMGADDFIAKPIDPAALRARVGAILRRQQAKADRSGLFDRLRDLHELLDSIVANTSLVVAALPASNPNAELLATIAAAAERAAELAGQLAAFAGKGPERGGR